MTKNGVMTAMTRFAGVYSLISAVTLIPLQISVLQSMARNRQPDLGSAGIGVGLVLMIGLALIAIRKPRVFAGGEDASVQESPRAALVFEIVMLVYAALLMIGGVSDLVDQWVRVLVSLAPNGALQAIGGAITSLIGNPQSAGHGVLRTIAAVVLVRRARRVLPGLIHREPSA